MDLRNAPDDDNGLLDLSQFYYKILPVLMRISLYKVPDMILKEIAIMIHSTLLSKSEWRGFAYEFGIQDNLLLNKINETAKMCEELPVYLVLVKVGQHNKSFGDVIEALLHQERFDILRHIMPNVQKILMAKDATEGKNVKTEVKRLVSYEEKSYDSPAESDYSTETLQNLNSVSISSDSCDLQGAKCIDSEPITENRKCEFNKFQGHSTKSDSSQLLSNSMELQIQPSSKLSEQSLDGQPSAPVEELLTVYILNTEYDNPIAADLSTKLGEMGIKAKMQSDFEHLLMIDSDGALRSILQEVDFIIPVVSETFLEQIHPRIYSKYLESQEAMNNRGLYQFILNEYRFNRYLNFRVKPVLVPGFNRGMLKYELVLATALRLWTEVPKLVKILRETKEMFPKILAH